jgi:hypothetical protein
MTTIPASKAFADWQKDPAYRAAYEALAPEYARAATCNATRPASAGKAPAAP